MIDNESIFIYRDVFFRLRDGVLTSENGKIIREFESIYPSLKRIRKECDRHVENLIADSIRASGDVLCEECGEPLRSHPYFKGAYAFGNENFYLHRRCDGVLVKL